MRIRKENSEKAVARWEQLEVLQDHYREFSVFLQDVLSSVLGFQCSEIHVDIGNFLADSTIKGKMVQAQRSQAKTTVAAIYVVWRLIHNPTLAVLIVSAGQRLADQIAKWCIDIINTMEELECMRPDPGAGDRTATTAFDIHHSLRGGGKEPSLASLPITGNIQGFRAGLLVADDIESSQNSRSAEGRQKLLDLTKEFASICTCNDILYLGTPQSTDSVYNGLPSRGYTVRIWPGRYPTVEQAKDYNGLLAPIITSRIAKNPMLQRGGGVLGDQGQPLDPVMLNEEALQRKEMEGHAHFQLQHMLCTKLTDADRFPLKVDKIIFMDIPAERAPVVIDSVHSDQWIIRAPMDFPGQPKYYQASGFSTEMGVFQDVCMHVDPAGGGANGDETGYAITKTLGAKIFVQAAGGVPGGYTDASLKALTEIAKKHNVRSVCIEKNYGHGALAAVWAPVLRKALPAISIEEVYETGQKELRIIDCLEPIISQGRLIMDKSLIEEEWASCAKYALDKRASYSLLFQMARITRERGALLHDDRLDALAGACRRHVKSLGLDAESIQSKIAKDRYNQMISTKLGRGGPTLGSALGVDKRPSLLSKIKRYI